MNVSNPFWNILIATRQKPDYMNFYHQEYPSNSLSLQTEAHATILEPMDGKLQSDARYYGYAKDRPLGSNLDHLESSPTDSFQPYCFCKPTPSITLSPWTQTHFTIPYATTANRYSNKSKELSLDLGPTRLTASPRTTI